MARIEIDPFYSSPTFSRATAGTDLFKKEDVQALAAAVSTHDHTTGKGAVLAAGSIPAGSITSAMIADGTIVAGDLADGAVTSAKILDGTITSADIADGTIQSVDIANGAILTANLGDNQITTAKLVGQSVHTLTLANPSALVTTTSASASVLDAINATVIAAGSDLLVWYVATLGNNTAGAILTLAMSLDGGADQNLLQLTIPTANAWVPIKLVQRYPGVSAAVHTVNMKWSTSAGTATTNSTVYRAFLAEEIKR